MLSVNEANPTQTNVCGGKRENGTVVIWGMLVKWDTKMVEYDDFYAVALHCISQVRAE